MTKTTRKPTNKKYIKYEMNQYQRVGMRKSTYYRASYNAKKADQTLVEYLDELVPQEPEYKEPKK